VFACVKIVVRVRWRAGRIWMGKANPLGRPARSPAVGTYRAQQVGGPALLIRRWSRCAAPAHQQEPVCRGPALGLNCHWPISSSSSLGSRFQRSKLISLRGSQPTHAMTNPTVQLLPYRSPANLAPKIELPATIRTYLIWLRKYIDLDIPHNPTSTSITVGFSESAFVPV
jgi:hypothetical protein